MWRQQRLTTTEVDGLLKRVRRKPLFSPDALSSSVEYGKDIVSRLLPHREPMLFVDGITGIDLEVGRIAGVRYLDPDDPVFSGHFPGYPIFPGTLQIEAVGQLGLCLHYFTEAGDTAAPSEPTLLEVRATRVLGAYYGEPAEPGEKLTLLAEVLYVEGYFAGMIGQCLVGQRITSVSAGEVLFL